jgi:hypothetical protein
MSESKEDAPSSPTEHKENMNPDDDVFLSIPSLSIGSPSAMPKMGGLDIGLAIRNKEEKDTSEEADIVRTMESLVLINFELPDGSSVEENFMMGQTVEYLKSFLQIECGVDMDSCQLFLGDKTMINPLSLCDFEEIAGGGDVDIRVEGDMEEDSRK